MRNVIRNEYTFIFSKQINFYFLKASIFILTKNRKIDTGGFKTVMKVM